MQEQFGYPELSTADKERILSANAQAVYALPDAALHTADGERDRSWVTNATVALSAAIASAR
jgi:hypothetical protein